MLKAREKLAKGEVQIRLPLLAGLLVPPRQRGAPTLRRAQRRAGHERLLHARSHHAWRRVLRRVRPLRHGRPLALRVRDVLRAARLTLANGAVCRILTKCGI